MHLLYYTNRLLFLVSSTSSCLFFLLLLLLWLKFIWLLRENWKDKKLELWILKFLYLIIWVNWTFPLKWPLDNNFTFMEWIFLVCGNLNKINLTFWNLLFFQIPPQRREDFYFCCSWVIIISRMKVTDHWHCLRGLSLVHQLRISCCVYIQVLFYRTH
jgi:hypothetical protein